MKRVRERQFQRKINPVLAYLHLGRHIDCHITMHTFTSVELQPLFIVLD
jgi:hypothetical protein